MSNFFILVCGMFFIAGIEGSDYCYNECNSIQQQSLYEQHCCLHSNRGETIKIINEEVIQFIICPPEIPTSCPLTCSDILANNSSATSGYYDITSNNGSTVSVYCDMEDVNCDGEGGWMRVVYINMTEPNATCPDGLVQRSFNGTDHDLCGKAHGQCSTTIFDTFSVKYTKVCGQVRGYQYGHTDGLFSSTATIDDYVSGISITYYNESQQREHIWTYASGENQDQVKEDDCPCNTGSSVVVPSFVGNDYYCESGHGTDLPNKLNYPNEVLFPSDPLWDGEDCNYLESPCCTNPDLPWFVKTFNESTDSEIELRICGNDYSGEDAPIDIAEIYVK